MLMNNDDIIPVDDAIERFQNHLLSHDRVILSAKFGDGKSFFLNEFKKKCEDSKDSPFKFITLYPVNYQVLENKDIFEIIKHDVLLQMLMLRMIDVNYETTNEMALAFYLQTHFSTVADSFFSMLHLIGNADPQIKGLFGIFKSISWVKSLKDKVNAVKKEIDQSDFLDSYLATFDEKSVYENDVVTKIIRDNIDTYQKSNNKKVVLIIEDMDRLDPAHLFRIMNVFSAHMDYGYRSLQPIDDSLVDNKFGVSNVVFVMHEQNTKALFHHFYGDYADYEGYMSKFYNKDIFNFSLNEEKEKYTLYLIVKETGLSEDRVTEIFPKSFLANKTMRQIVCAMDKVNEQFESIEVKPGVKANPLLLKLIVIAKRLGVSNEHISSVIIRRLKLLDQLYIKYLLPVIALNPKTRILEIVNVDVDRTKTYIIGCQKINDDGSCSFGIGQNFGDNEDNKVLQSNIERMLSLLGY